jgi:hypothetical protein
MGQNIDGEGEYDRSGISVSLSSDGLIVAIGAFLNDGNGEDSGHVRVYQYNSDSNSWTKMGQDIDGEALSDNSGISVSLSSDGLTVAIGAPNNRGNKGHVRVYEYNTSLLIWEQMGADIDGEAAFDYSGYSVSLSSDGSIVAIGAQLNDGNGDNSNSGHVRVYQYTAGSDSWTQKGEDIDGEAAGDQSGNSVSLSSDGSIVAISAPKNEGVNGSYPNKGHVRVYKYIPIPTLDVTNIEVTGVTWNSSSRNYNGLLQFKTSNLGIPYQHRIQSAANSIDELYDADGAIHSLQLLLISPSQTVTFLIDLYNPESPSTDYTDVEPTQTFSYTFPPAQ